MATHTVAQFDAATINHLHTPSYDLDVWLLCSVTLIHDLRSGTKARISSETTIDLYDALVYNTSNSNPRFTGQMPQSCPPTPAASHSPSKDDPSGLRIHRQISEGDGREGPDVFVGREEEATERIEDMDCHEGLGDP